jgi:NADH:ubiquinone oxidoreductase subunit 3 (subunit A)
MLDQWVFIAFLLPVGLLLPAVAIAMGFLLGPRKPNPLKGDTYECGIETVGSTWVQFKAQYYVYALVFVVFDVEAVFLGRRPTTSFSCTWCSKASCLWPSLRPA